MQSTIRTYAAAFGLAALLGSVAQAAIITPTSGRRVVSDTNVDNGVFDAGTYNPGVQDVVTVGSFLIPAGSFTAAEFSIDYQGYFVNTAPMSGSVTLVGVRSDPASSIGASDFATTTSSTTIIQTNFVTTSTPFASNVTTGTNAALLAFVNSVTPGEYAFLGLRWDGGTITPGQGFELFRFDTGGGSLSSAKLTLTPVPEPASLGLLSAGIFGLTARRRRA